MNAWMLLGFITVCLGITVFYFGSNNRLLQAPRLWIGAMIALGLAECGMSIYMIITTPLMPILLRNVGMILLFLIVFVFGLACIWLGYTEIEDMRRKNQEAAF